MVVKLHFGLTLPPTQTTTHTAFSPCFFSFFFWSLQFWSVHTKLCLRLRLSALACYQGGRSHQSVWVCVLHWKSWMWEKAQFVCLYPKVSSISQRKKVSSLLLSSLLACCSDCIGIIFFFLHRRSVSLMLCAWMSDVICLFPAASCTVWLKLACHQCVLPHMPLYCMNWVKYVFSWLIYGFVAVGIRIVTRDYNGMLGTSLGVCAHDFVCVVGVWVGGRVLQKGGMDRISSYLGCPVPHEV